MFPRHEPQWLFRQTMCPLNSSPVSRNLSSPLDDTQLAPLDRRCETVQFDSPLSDTDHRRLAALLRDYPGVALRVFSHCSSAAPDLSFLRHYSSLKRFEVDLVHLESLRGVECLPDSLEYFSFGFTRSKRHSLEFLSRFKQLRELHLEGHTKDIEVLAKLTSLESLGLRSITLPDLAVLLPLRHLWSLEIKLGGTIDLSLLPRVGRLKYLELWMIKGLQNIDPIAEIGTLQNLWLEALKNVTSLPSFRRLPALRRVTLDTMKGLSNLSPIAEAPGIEELAVLCMGQLPLAAFEPFAGHATLKFATVGLGSERKNRQIESLLGLPPFRRDKFNFSYR